MAATTVLTQLTVSLYQTIYYKAAVSLCVCLSVCLSVTPPPFSTRLSDRNQIWHAYMIYPGLIRGSFKPKQIWHTPLQESPREDFRGSKIQKSGKCHELPRKSITKSHRRVEVLVVKFQIFGKFHELKKIDSFCNPSPPPTREGEF